MSTKRKIDIIFIIAIIVAVTISFAAYGNSFGEYDKDIYTMYRNNPYGYEIILLKNLALNEDMFNIKSRFESENLIVEVYYDNFEDTSDSTATYNDYGNRGIKDNLEFKITDEYNKSYDENNAHVLLYERRKLYEDKTDRNYYATLAFSRSEKEIATVFIKSAEPIDIDYIMPDFKFIAKSGNLKDNKTFSSVDKSFDIKTEEFYNRYFINSEKISFGIFEPTFPMKTERYVEMEKLFDYNFPVCLLYNSFLYPFKTEAMNNAKEMGKVIEYTLYTTDVIDEKEKDITLDILEGKYDEYLDKLAESFNEYDFPVLFRINNEMNGGWVLYSSYHVGKDTDLYVDCWRYIYNKFKEHGVDNLIFVWNPNERSFPDFSYNNYLNYYPGDEYVDIVGLTAYNTGNYYEGEIWRSFIEAYDHFYYEYEKQFTHPFMITEFSGAGAGGDKKQWFNDMFTNIIKYDRIKLAVLWNGQDFDFTKPGKTISRNYRIDLDEEISNIVRNRLQEFK